MSAISRSHWGRGVVVVASLAAGCAAGSGIHPEERVPVSWSLSVADSPDSRASLVCEFEQAKPCVIPHSTAGKPKYASFMVHVWGLGASNFTGSLIVTYMDDPDPRNYVSPINLTSNGKEVHHSIFSKITSAAGQYSATAHLIETGDGSPPKTRDFSVPVTVQ